MINYLKQVFYCLTNYKKWREATLLSKTYCLLINKHYIHAEFLKELSDEFFKKKKLEDKCIGSWGVFNSQTGESKIHGEMYDVNGAWIAGPKIKD